MQELTLVIKMMDTVDPEWLLDEIIRVLPKEDVFILADRSDLPQWLKEEKRWEPKRRLNR